MAVIVAVRIENSIYPIRRETRIGDYIRAILYRQKDGSTEKFLHVVTNGAGNQVKVYFIDIPTDEWCERKSDWLFDSGQVQRSELAHNWSVYKNTLKRKETYASSAEKSEVGNPCR